MHLKKNHTKKNLFKINKRKTSINLRAKATIEPENQF